MSKSNPDRRVQKTKQLLKDALISLMQVKNYESITIKSVLERANVGRSTFYMHYLNKDDLLHNCFGDILCNFEQYLSVTSKKNNLSRKNDETVFVLKVFKFVELNENLFKALLVKEGVPEFNQYIYDYIYSIIVDINKAKQINRKTRDFEKEISAHYKASAVVGILKWWVCADMPITSNELYKNYLDLEKHG